MVRRAAIAGALWLALAGTVLAQPKITMPPEIKVAVGRLASVAIHFEGKGFTYQILGDQLDAFREYDPGPKNVRLRLLGYKPSVAYVVVAVADGDKVALGKCKVTIGKPEPGPGPDPPGPTPGPVKGLHVLILYESADLPTMPASQQEILFSKAVRDALDAATPTGEDKSTHAWRMWDKDVDASAEAKVWQGLLSAAHKVVPCVIFADESGKVAHEGALPATVEEFSALLAKYKG